MKLPRGLAALANKVVCSDLRRFKKKDSLGILFDATTYKRAQMSTVLEQFGDCERGDYQNLVVWGGEDEDGSWGPKAFRDDCLPFMLWSPDELFDDRDELSKRLAKNARTKTTAVDRDGSFPQYQTMWFLHGDGSVTFADVDGTFQPMKKSKKLVAHYDELLLRLATPADISGGEGSSEQLLSAAVEKAEAKLEADKPKEALALLRPLLAPYATGPGRDGDDDLADLVGSAWHVVGMAEHEAGDDAKSLDAYLQAIRWDDTNIHAAANVMRIEIDRKAYAKAIDRSTKLLAKWTRKIVIDEEATVRALRFVAMARSGKVAAAHRELGTYAKKADKSERAATKKVMAEELADEADLKGELVVIKRALT